MRELSRHSWNRRTLFSGRLRIRSEAAQPVSGRAVFFIRRRFPGANAFAHRRGEHGSAILETFLSMILLGMILFGILQIFQLAVTDMVTDYAAFRGARSAAVGFKDEFSFREALIKAAPVSGSLVTPDPSTFAGMRWNSVETEKSLLRGFMEDRNVVEYADWVGVEQLHTNYKCPHYGERLTASCDICGSKRNNNHYVRAAVNGVDTIHFSFDFVNYPLNVPLHDWLTGKDSITISGDAELTNHSAAFLE